MQPINPDAFSTELGEPRRQLRQDVRAPRPTILTRVLVVALLVALAAVVGAASFDARRASGHVESVVAHAARDACPQLGTAPSWPLRRDPACR